MSKQFLYLQARANEHKNDEMGHQWARRRDLYAAKVARQEWARQYRHDIAPTFDKLNIPYEYSWDPREYHKQWTKYIPIRAANKIKSVFKNYMFKKKWPKRPSIWKNVGKLKKKITIPERLKLLRYKEFKKANPKFREPTKLPIGAYPSDILDKKYDF